MPRILRKIVLNIFSRILLLLTFSSCLSTAVTNPYLQFLIKIFFLIADNNIARIPPQPGYLYPSMLPYMTVPLQQYQSNHCIMLTVKLRSNVWNWALLRVSDQMQLLWPVDIFFLINVHNLNLYIYILLHFIFNILKRIMHNNTMKITFCYSSNI